tara:strand:+ start:260 stop:577 length:318 start_codon:yes stop_codon:yes gene_type:complete
MINIIKYLEIQRMNMTSAIGEFKMKLSTREIAWEQRKQNKKPKHLKKNKKLPVKNAQWRKQTAEEFRVKYGGWWIFTGVDLRHNKRNKNWIMQYWKGRTYNASKK